MHLGLEGWGSAQAVVDNDLVPEHRRARKLADHTYLAEEGMSPHEGELSPSRGKEVPCGPDLA